MWSKISYWFGFFIYISYFLFLIYLDIFKNIPMNINPLEISIFFIVQGIGLKCIFEKKDNIQE